MGFDGSAQTFFFFFPTPTKTSVERYSERRPDATAWRV
jgi:hypothetical protein